MKTERKSIIKNVFVIFSLCFFLTGMLGGSAEALAGQTEDPAQEAQEEANVYIPNDPWKDPKGTNTPKWEPGDLSGTNWWAQAVQLPEAWYYKDLFQEIKVGIVDGGFYTDHEDVTITVLNPEQNQKANSGFKEHGTGVAAVIGAEWDNAKGITGVMNHVKLYGYALGGEDSTKMELDPFDGIVACMEQGCKVINLSVGPDIIISEDYINLWADRLITLRLAYGSDFILVESAGNDGIETSEVSLLAGVTLQVVEERLRVLSQDPEFLELFPDVVNLSPGEVTDCVLIVGGVAKTSDPDQYTMHWRSNYGAEISVCAPFNDVLTAVKGSGASSTYGYQRGSSFSAPIAAGIVGLVWSINPDMTNTEVCQMILFTAFSNLVTPNWITDHFGKIGGANDSLSFMVNAKDAVELAIRKNNIDISSIKEDDSEKTDDSAASSEQADDSTAQSEQTASSSDDGLAAISGLTLTAASTSWTESIVVDEEGNFTGYYYNDNLGNYNGQMMTERWCSSYRGKFTIDGKVNEYTYLLKVSDFSYDYEPGTDEVREGMHYIYTDTKLIGDEMYLYLPGHNMTDVPDLFSSLIMGKYNEDQLLCYAIFNIDLSRSLGVFTSDQIDPGRKTADPAGEQTEPETDTAEPADTENNGDQENPYVDVVRTYEAEYGKLEFYPNNYGSGFYTGVFLIRLLDFDQDGVDELMIGYAKQFVDPQMGEIQMAIPSADIWTLENGAPVLVYEGADVVTGSIDQRCMYIEWDGKYCLVTGSIGFEPHLEIQSFENGSFHGIYDIREEMTESGYQWIINGAVVSEEQGIEAYNQIMDNAMKYTGSVQADQGEAEESIRADLTEAYRQLGIDD